MKDGEQMTTTQTAEPLSGTLVIERSINKDQAGSLSIDNNGVLGFRNMADVMEFAKLMAVSGHAVPKHCRNQPGVCLGIATQAIMWGMSPYAVASKSYVVNDILAYESQLIHAVIEQRAPLVGRLKHEFTGEGSHRRCRVWAIVRGSNEELSHTSPDFATITPKNSPLWKTKPDLQLYYNTTRDWARVYFPDVILGVYSTDELDESAPLIVETPSQPVSRVASLRRSLLPDDDTVDAIEGE